MAASDAAPAATPARVEDDRAAATHPFVQQLSDLFDARIVRIEAAGTLPPGSVPPADPAPGEPVSTAEQKLLTGR